MDVKKTLMNLHERFPEMTLEDLFSVLECIEETNSPVWVAPGYTKFPDYNVTCSNGGTLFKK